MIRLAVASVRHRIPGVLAALVAVLVGTTLFAACGAVFETALRLQAPPQRLAGTAVIVAPDTDYRFAGGSGSTALPERPNLTEAQLDAVRRVPGVGRVVPDASFAAVVLRDGRPVRADLGDRATGHAWASAALTPYRLTSGTAPRGSRDVVLDRDTARAAAARVGATITVAVSGHPRPYRVSGIARSARPVQAPALFFATAFGHRAHGAGVLPSAGTSRTQLLHNLRRDLPAGLQVRTGDSRGTAEFAGVGGVRLPLIILAAVFGGLVVVVMGIVVAATCTLTVRRRQRELALLRSIGATPKQAHRLVVVEALGVGLVGVLGGLLLGRIAGRTLFDVLVEHGLVPRALTFHQGPIPFAAAAVVALVAVRVSAELAARPAGRVAPIEALRDADLPAVRIGAVPRVVAGTLAVGTVALAVTTMFLSPENATAMGGPAVLTGAIALALVAPAAVRRAVRRSRARSVGGRLARANLRARAVQYGAVLAPVTIATAIALGNIYSQTTQDDAARAAYLDQLHADVVIGSDAGGVDPALAGRIARLPQVTGASAFVTSKGWLEDPYDGGHTSDPLRLLGIDRPDRTSVYGGQVTAGSLRDLRPGAVALPAELADDLGVRLGRRVTVRLGDGDAYRARVVALLDQPGGYEQLVLPAATLAAHVDAGLASDVLVRTDRPDEVLAEVAALRLPGTTMGDADLLRAEFDAGLGVVAWINYLIAALALAYAAIATINTLAVSILDRRREFGLQRLVGATTRDVRRMLHREVAVVGGVGWLAGAVISVFTIWPIAVASGTLVPTGPWWVLPGSALAIAAMLVPVTEVCARLAQRAPAAEVVASVDA